ncbi:hypothetical protein Lser_V15G00331 [Lactuca serriola]
MAGAASALFLLDIKGHVLVCCDYRGNVSAVQGDQDSQGPVVYDNGVTFLMIASRQSCCKNCVNVCSDMFMIEEDFGRARACGEYWWQEFVESLAPDVQKLLLSSSCRPLVRKKAALCLLRLFRKKSDVVNVDGWSDRMAQLLDERDLGVLKSLMNLFVALLANNHEAYSICLPECVKILERLARNQDVPQEYTYYGIPSPWLQVKTMRALQYFPTVEDPTTRRALFEVLQRILMGTDVVKNVNKNNASHAVLFEALALVMHLEFDSEKEMMSQCVALLGKFIVVREPNIRYLGLVNVHEIIKRHQAQIITSLKDPDIRWHLPVATQ